MKWRNHALMGISIGLIMDLNPWEIGWCALGANLPDQLEKIGPFRIIGHRTLTHEVFLWLVPLLAFLMIPYFTADARGVAAVKQHLDGAHFLTIRSWVLFLPGLIHLAGDVLTPRGIQAAGRKITLRLFETGHPFEYLVAGLFAGLALIHKLGLESVLPGVR